MLGAVSSNVAPLAGNVGATCPVGSFLWSEQGRSSTRAQLCSARAPCVRAAGRTVQESVLQVTIMQIASVKTRRVFGNKCYSRLKCCCLFAGADGGGNPSPRGLARCPGVAPASPRSILALPALPSTPLTRHGHARSPSCWGCELAAAPRAHQSPGPPCEGPAECAEGTGV